jgi:hypothetical protein
MSGFIADIARLMVGWETPNDSRFPPASDYGACRSMWLHRFEKAEAGRPVWGIRVTFHGIDEDAQIDDFLTVEPGGMIHAMACSRDLV